MHILVDILHPAHLMFYKRAISILKHKHRLTVLVRPRGNLAEFARKELDVPFKIIGKHQKTRLGKIWGLIHRVLYLVIEGYRNPFDVITSFGGFYAAIAAKLLGKRSVIFHDTYEYKYSFYLCHQFASTFVIPSSQRVHSRNIETFNGYKELAYLYHFTPSDKILKEYNVDRKQYVFIRHIAHVSLDCWEHSHEAILDKILDYLRAREYTIVISAEQNADAISLPSSLTRIIRKPTSEMHSLLYHARCVISSGATVAQEAALLRVPSIYIGGLHLRAQDELVHMELLHKPSNEDVISVLENCLQKVPEIQPSKNNNWEDTTEVILRYLGS